VHPAEVRSPPDLTAVRLHQSLGYRQAQAHSGDVRSTRTKSSKFPDDARRRSRAVSETDTFRLLGRCTRSHGAPPTAILPRPAFQKCSSARSFTWPPQGVFERVIQQIGNRLLNLLVIELENWQFAAQRRVQSHLLPNKGFMPSRRQFAQAIPRSFSRKCSTSLPLSSAE